MSPLSPLEKRLSPLPTGTDFLNDDNGLHAFCEFVPAVPANKCRDPEEIPDFFLKSPRKVREPSPTAPRNPALWQIAGPARQSDFTRHGPGPLNYGCGDPGHDHESQQIEGLHLGHRLDRACACAAADLVEPRRPPALGHMKDRDSGIFGGGSNGKAGVQMGVQIGF